MNEFVIEILDSYQVRKSVKQKEAFIELLRTRYPELRVETGGFLKKSRNVILGNPDSADVILAAHYDTCSMLLFPNLIFVNNPIATFLYALIICLPFYAVLFSAEIFMLVAEYPLWTVYLVMLGIIAVFLLVLLGGKANPHTANDNTSGVIGALKTYEILPEDLKRRTCVVLFDNEESGLLGSRLFQRFHPTATRKTLLLNFDCIGDGDDILAVYSKNVKEEIDDLCVAFAGHPTKRPLARPAANTMYPSDQKGFAKGIGFAAMHHCALGYYIPRIHTKRDVILEEENVDYVSKSVMKYLIMYLR